MCGIPAPESKQLIGWKTWIPTGHCSRMARYQGHFLDLQKQPKHGDLGKLPHNQDLPNSPLCLCIPLHPFLALLTAS